MARTISIKISGDASDLTRATAEAAAALKILGAESDRSGGKFHDLRRAMDSGLGRVPMFGGSLKNLSQGLAVVSSGATSAITGFSAWFQGMTAGIPLVSGFGQ